MHFHEHAIQIDRRDRGLRRRDALDPHLKILEVRPIGDRKRDGELLPIINVDLADADPCLPVGAVAHIQKIIVGNRRR